MAAAGVPQPLTPPPARPEGAPWAAEPQRGLRHPAPPTQSSPAGGQPGARAARGPACGAACGVHVVCVHLLLQQGQGAFSACGRGGSRQQGGGPNHPHHDQVHPHIPTHPHLLHSAVGAGRRLRLQLPPPLLAGSVGVHAQRHLHAGRGTAHCRTHLLGGRYRWPHSEGPTACSHDQLTAGSQAPGRHACPLAWPWRSLQPTLRLSNLLAPHRQSCTLALPPACGPPAAPRSAAGAAAAPPAPSHPQGRGQGEGPIVRGSSAWRLRATPAPAAAARPAAERHACTNHTTAGWWRRRSRSCLWA